jgi:hypothetical protein
VSGPDVGQYPPHARPFLNDLDRSRPRSGLHAPDERSHKSRIPTRLVPHLKQPQLSDLHQYLAEAIDLCESGRAALREIVTYWFDRGAAGFLVDMAASLVKDDPGLLETSRLWSQTRAWLDENYPGRVLISEWGHPRLAARTSFCSSAENTTAWLCAGCGTTASERPTLAGATCPAGPTPQPVAVALSGYRPPITTSRPSLQGRGMLSKPERRSC